MKKAYYMLTQYQMTRILGGNGGGPNEPEPPEPPPTP